MKSIEVTYEAMYPLETGDYEQGEAAFILPVTDELAAEYLAGRATDRGAVNLVETALEAVEVMRGRVYVRGSIRSLAAGGDRQHAAGDGLRRDRAIPQV